MHKDTLGEAEVKQKKRKDHSDSLGSLTAWTAPSGSKKSRVTVEEVEIKEDIGPLQSTLTPPVASSSSTTQIPKASTRTNPIYLFYESVALNANKLSGLIGHLKVHFPAMHQLYLVLKDRKEPPTDDNIAIAARWKVLDPTNWLGSIQVRILQRLYGTPWKHTVHLAAVELLKGIGVLKHNKKKKGEDNYQDSVTAPIDRTFDDDAIGQEEDKEEQDEDDSSQMLLGVLSAIEKFNQVLNGAKLG
ncbi:hypothetical protein PILCRDRAFT_13510 [Piloderma croceum F 1598]|uniref:Uncharacterized protein n=1 Tax=Piloderma croceum (strain F 1598) TaxID=765440 RepID=A0A0C3F6Q0_PILCF|nr:hypothetical protein PILCRDRAFT_13510 [Piloderma croceum F 1598]